MPSVLRRGSVLALAAVFAFHLAGPEHDLAADVVGVPLTAELDQFGSQVETIQGYRDATETRLAFGIYDTGASVATLSADEQANFIGQGSGVPIKVPNGAQAQGIDGTLVGDVSQPVTFLADGLHAVSFSLDGLIIDFSYDLSRAASVPGVQVFVGTPDGSRSLPNITGTPIHYPSGLAGPFPSGSAAKVDMLGYQLDLGELFKDDPILGGLFDGIVVPMPDLEFVPPGAKLAQVPGVTTEVLRVPLGGFGDQNYPDSGDTVTFAPNPIQTSVTIEEGGTTISGQKFLFDTGAQLSVVTPELAEALAYVQETSIDVQGAAGASFTVPGFTLDALELPRDDDGDGIQDGTLRFTDAPVYVIDLPEGVDGILGMNLFNTAGQILYDPYDPAGPSLQATFLTGPRDVPDPDELLLIQLLAGLDPVFAGALGVVGDTLYYPRFQVDFETSGVVVPEPSTLLLAAVGGLALWAYGCRRRLRG